MQKELLAYCEQLQRDEYHDDNEDCQCWPRPQYLLSEWLGIHEPVASGVCTNGARLVAKHFDGVVMGFHHEDNPTATIADGCGGHDFAIVQGRYLVDFWAWSWEESLESPVIDLESRDEEVLIDVAKFGDKKKWSLTWPDPKAVENFTKRGSMTGNTVAANTDPDVIRERAVKHAAKALGEMHERAMARA